MSTEVGRPSPRRGPQPDTCIENNYFFLNKALLDFFHCFENVTSVIYLSI
jgi:hypothetical protein